MRGNAVVAPHVAVAGHLAVLCEAVEPLCKAAAAVARTVVAVDAKARAQG